MSQPEPWLRGPLQRADGTPLHPVLAHIRYTYQQMREELEQYTRGLDADVWREVPGIPALGFQLKHIAGSTQRLFTYAQGEQLTAEQVERARSEQLPEGSLRDLLEAIWREFEAISLALESIYEDSFLDTRLVGRKKLEVTLAGLLIHISEHTQRHLGQAVTTCNLLRATKESS